MSVIEGEKVPGRVVSLFVLKHTPPVYLCSRHHPGTDITPAASLVPALEVVLRMV